MYGNFNMSNQPVIDTDELDDFVDQMLNGTIDSPVDFWNEFFEKEVVLYQTQNEDARSLYRELTNRVKTHLECEISWRWGWDVFNSGSMFDHTKVDEPDEFDCLFFPKIKSGCITAEFENVPPGFCLIRVCDENSFPDYFLEGGFVSATKWRNYFTQTLTDFIDRKTSHWTCVKSYDGSAAVPVKYTGQKLNDIDVDLVPALHISQWPPRANELNFLSEEDAISIKEKGHHVVAKAYKDEHRYKDCLWRLAFNNAEKELTKFADPGGETCRKKVLRIVKRIFDIAKGDLEDFKAESYVGRQLVKAAKIARTHYPIGVQTGTSKLESIRFCTYDIRSLVWNIWYEDGVGHTDWSNRKIHRRRKMVLREIQKMLSGEKIVKNFFIKQKQVVNHLSVEERTYFYIMAKLAEIVLSNYGNTQISVHGAWRYY